MNEEPRACVEPNSIIGGLTTERKMEIINIAKELLVIARSKGIRESEFCQLGRSCEFLK